MAAAGATASAAAGASTGSDSEAAAALESGSYCDQAWLAAHPWFSAWLQQWQAVCQHLAPFGGCKHLKPCPTRAWAPAASGALLAPRGRRLPSSAEADSPTSLPAHQPCPPAGTSLDPLCSQEGGSHSPGAACRCERRAHGR